MRRCKCGRPISSNKLYCKACAEEHSLFKQLQESGAQVSVIEGEALERFARDIEPYVRAKDAKGEDTEGLLIRFHEQIRNSKQIIARRDPKGGLQFEYVPKDVPAAETAGGTSPEPLSMDAETQLV